MKFYLCKYIPPRADFLATMTAEEKQMDEAARRLLE